MIKATDLRAGQAIRWEGQLYIVKEAALQTRGNWRSFIICKFKRIPDGVIKDERVQSHLAIEDVNVDRRPMTFIYQTGSDYVMQDQETFEEYPVPGDLIGEGRELLVSDTPVTCLLYENKVLDIELPGVVELTITETSPVVKGATATNQLKEATVETGAKVRVPPFINVGEKVRIRVETREYLERAKSE
jgi:elongation factor P